VADLKTTTSATTMTTTTTTDNKSISGSQYLAKYIKNVQQANEATAAQYAYRLSRFEKYIAMAYKKERQQEQRQQQNQELIITLDDVINELKKNGNNNTKIDPYDLLSGFVAYLEEEKI
jgi:hypothetical protein